jgi:hypothetical protein
LVLHSNRPCDVLTVQKASLCSPLLLRRPRHRYSRVDRAALPACSTAFGRVCPTTKPARCLCGTGHERLARIRKRRSFCTGDETQRHLYGACKTRRFARSFHGRIHSGPKNVFAFRPLARYASFTPCLGLLWLLPLPNEQRAPVPHNASASTSPSIVSPASSKVGRY